MHVAFTRAGERLLLSGVVALKDAWPQARSSGPPLNWIGANLEGSLLGRIGADNAAERGKSQPALQTSDTKPTLRGIGSAIVVVWWRFFDWLAVVPWKTLLLVSVLGLILAAMLKDHGWFLLFIVVSVIIKVG